MCLAGACLLARRLSGIEVARARYQAPVRNVGTARLDVFGRVLDAVGVRENSKQLNLRGGEYRCEAAGQTGP